MSYSPDHKQNEKAVRLVEYLIRLASLRTKLVREIADYESVLFLNDIPRQKGCFARAWGLDEEYDSDIWVEVQNRREPELPGVPDRCRDWIDKIALKNKNDLPKLPPEITRPVRNPTWREGSDQPQVIHRTERLDDHPEVRKAWDRYVEESWLPWLEEHNAWESVHSVYSSLFAVHQEQLRLGEEYELVLGLGLLTWQTPSGQHVRRHLIVANALLEFDARLGKFNVGPNPDGASVRPELDMLDIEEQPARAEETAKATLTKAADDPWERDCIEEVLKALVHSINPEGEYEDTLEAKSVRATAKPIVEYAPAIILRKRSARGLTETLKRIKERIQKGEQIPPEFADLAEIPQRREAEFSTDPGKLSPDFDGEVFFPKPSNEEQRRIVDKIRGASGVLVQGPPGTGKSHTIANLICHLLATGQRILITAKTPRALQVLEGLLPDEIRPLCINLLGSGMEEKRSLETSVGGILRKSKEWDNLFSRGALHSLEQKLQQLREEKAQIERRLRAIRESETHPQTVAEGAYSGTAARIAQAVKAQERNFDWFADAVPLDKTCPISESDLQNALGVLRRLAPDKRRELALNLPDTLPTPERFAEFVNIEKKAKEEENTAAVDADPQIADHLAQCNESSIQALQSALSALLDKRRKLLALRYSWMDDAVRDVLSESSSVWRELYRVTRKVTSGVADLVALADATVLEIPEGENTTALLEDARKLKAHLENGGKLGFGPFRPRLVKECLYVLKTVRVNGCACADLSRLQMLADVLRVRIDFEKAWGEWAGRCRRSRGRFSLQLRVLNDLCDALHEALLLEDAIKECGRALEQCGGLTEPMWIDEPQVHRMKESCRLALARLTKRCAIEDIRQIETAVAALVAKGDAHPVALELLEAIRNRDIDAFARATARSDKERSFIQKAAVSLRRLGQVTPELTADLEQTCKETCWETRIHQIRDVWHWAQAKTWLEEYIRKEDAPSLAQRARQIEDEISASIAKIASLHAWDFCFSRLQEDHRRNMKAWQKNISKLTKSGKGKQDYFHHKEAQKHLRKCQEAVPAWVMPVHRVWDTVDPEPGMFDVIIVDEASQCGFEALPLMYLGKKILIVGDDKQISPEAEGIGLSPVTKLIDQFLYDFEHKSAFNINSSLFDHGELRYSSRHIVLREHFRCMPEIIRFSNDLCYRGTPLIPLRQYGQDRLTPLEHVPVSHGYREGEGNRVMNRPEANAIVEKIVELCKDKRYAEKTMGVVVLQGEAQASLIEGQLLERLGAAEMEKRRLICGNPYSFQGDERHVMFLSMVAAPNERIGPLTKPADERRFNVAASRARDQMWLFHSVTCDDLSTSCLRRRLLEFFEGTEPQKVGGIDRQELELRAAQDNRAVVKPPQPFDSWFEVDVALELLRKGFVVIPQFDVAGKRIDLVVEGGQARLAVECDGDEFHGLDQYEQDMQRQRMLERCGWVFFRVRASQFYADRQAALRYLWGMLDDRGIRPQARKDSTEGKEPRILDRRVSSPAKPNQQREMPEPQELVTDMRVKVGDTVEYIDEENPETEKQALITYDKSNPDWGMVNVNTPIAQALLGARVGDVVEARLPIGSVHLRIKEIRRPK